MSKISKNLDHGNIKVIFDDDGLNVTSEAVPSPPASRSFTILKTLGNIFFYTPGTDHKQKANQKAQFRGGVTLEIPLSNDVVNHPAMRGKSKKSLTVVYYDKNEDEWVAFPDQRLDEGANKAIVQFDHWIKDPPVGWGTTTN